MNTLLDLISYFIILSDIFGGVRLLYCLIRIKFEPDEGSSYFKKMIHVLIFLIIANTCLSTELLIEKYFI